ncbi:MAG: glycoside hydrolase family 130 protein, partial [Acidimicrobiia bacterium]
GEYSIEAASLTNPSMVPGPDQSGLESGAQRFIISQRGIGEGHVSSIEFRSGIIDKEGKITMDPRSRFARTGSHRPAVFDKPVFCALLEEMKAFDETAKFVCQSLPDRFELRQLEAAMAKVEGKRAPRRLKHPTTKAMHWLATSNYELSFPSDSDLSERVIFPGSGVESGGVEDARFVRLVDDDGSVVWYATYTAYDGSHILPQLIETSDFTNFRIDTMSGRYAHNKGVALFPRKIKGHYAALSRYDSENNYFMTSDSLRIWEKAKKIESPETYWDLARMGNGGSPIETDAGWLVITHGVGPFRTYSLGAILLEIDDPSRVIGRLEEPLLVPNEEEREGYVPNVVYSCGSMLHGDLLILPYGISDVACRVATVPLDRLLSALTG